MAKKHAALHEELSATFPPEVVQKWEDMVTAWSANPKAPNPYTEPVTSAYSDWLS
jgi:hypothetical protein